MRKLLLIGIFVFFVSFVFAQEDTGMDKGDTGIFDTGDVTGLTDEELAQLTSEQIAEYIDSVEDISLLNPDELNNYIAYKYYDTSISIERGVTSATLTSDGILINGNGGSRVDLNNLPQNTIISLEADGRIVLHCQGGEEVDAAVLFNDNTGQERQPLKIVSVNGDVSFSDGSILYENSEIELIDKHVFSVTGTFNYQGLEISSKTGNVLVYTETLEENNNLIETYGAKGYGSVVINPESLYVTNDVQVIIRENQQFKVGTGQGIILRSHLNGIIMYDVSQEVPQLSMYGYTTVFNGMRLLEQNSAGNFYTLRGGKPVDPYIYTHVRLNDYNKDLQTIYGFLPDAVDMDITTYSSGASLTPLESYTYRSGDLAEVFQPKDATVPNYLLSSAFDSIPKKKAVILWSSQQDDMHYFQSIAETKQQQLIAQGYAPEDVEVVHFKSKGQFFSELDGVSDSTYMEIVSHGWTDKRGGFIGTENYYTLSTTGERSYDSISSSELASYIQQRGDVFNQEGALFIGSTCHSAAKESYYDIERGLVVDIPKNAPLVQAVHNAASQNVIAYGSAGPLYQGYVTRPDGTKSITLFSVAGMHFEGVRESTEQILEENLPYFRVD